MRHWPTSQLSGPLIDLRRLWAKYHQLVVISECGISGGLFVDISSYDGMVSCSDNDGGVPQGAVQPSPQPARWTAHFQFFS